MSRPATSLRVALVQMAATNPDPADAVAAAVADAGPVDLVVVPELALTGYPPASGAPVPAVRCDGPEVGRVASSLARTGAVAVVGAAVGGGRGRPTNEALVIGPDGVRGRYAKTHLWVTETKAFEPGSALVTVPVGEVTLGLMVCFDVELPEVARTLALDGADVLITVAANMEPYGPDHALFARARALENRLPHVYVNAAGPSGRWRFVGESVAVGHDGTTLGRLGSEPGSTVVAVPLGPDRRGADDPADVRPRYRRHRRPDLYRNLEGER